MDCPRCHAELEPVGEGLFEDIETHACSRCGGVFYPRGSLDRLDDAVAVNVEKLPLVFADEPALRCPHPHPRRGGGYRSAAEATLEPAWPKDDPDVWLARCAECGGFWVEGDDALDRLRRIALERSELENQRLNAETVRRQKQKQPKR